MPPRLWTARGYRLQRARGARLKRAFRCNDQFLCLVFLVISGHSPLFYFCGIISSGLYAKFSGSRAEVTTVLKKKKIYYVPSYRLKMGRIYIHMVRFTHDIE